MSDNAFRFVANCGRKQSNISECNVRIKYNDPSFNDKSQKKTQIEGLLEWYQIVKCAKINHRAYDQ